MTLLFLMLLSAAVRQLLLGCTALLHSTFRTFCRENKVEVINEEYWGIFIGVNSDVDCTQDITHVEAVEMRYLRSMCGITEYDRVGKEKNREFTREKMCERQHKTGHLQMV